MHHYNSTQYCKTETVFSMFPFLQTNITSQMWPSRGKGGYGPPGNVVKLSTFGVGRVKVKWGQNRSQKSLSVRFSKTIRRILTEPDWHMLPPNPHAHPYLIVRASSLSDPALRLPVVLPTHTQRITMKMTNAQIEQQRNKTQNHLRSSG